MTVTMLILLFSNILLLMVNRYIKRQTVELYNLSVINLEQSEMLSAACLLFEKHKTS